jgi:hypothetical protein
MKYIILTAFGLLFVAACTTVKESDDYKKLNAQNASLQEQLRAQEKEVEEITASISKIDSNLMKISEHVEVMDGVNLRELIKKPGEIDLMITEIGDYVQQNNEMIAKLEKKVQESGTINNSLKTMIAQKNQQVEEKEKQIQTLLATIEKMQKEYSSEIGRRDSVIANVRQKINETEVALANTKETVRAKEEELNTGFVTFGTRQELAQRGVVKPGNKAILSNELNDEDFKPVSISATEEVDLGITKRQRLATSHPTDSYYFVKTDGRSLLKIVDKQKFWSVSKYLVVVIEN